MLRQTPTLEHPACDNELMRITHHCRCSDRHQHLGILHVIMNWCALPTISDAGACMHAADLQQAVQKRSSSGYSSGSRPQTRPRPKTGLPLDPSSPQDTCFAAMVALTGADEYTVHMYPDDLGMHMLMT
jgi:hypothetical protein